MARVTVFGGSGFIGRHLVRRLAQDGHIVRVAVRHTNEAAFLKTSGDVGQISLRATDIADQASVEAAVADSDWVINLVGILYERGRATFEAMHVEAPRRLAKACKAAGIKTLVHVSALGASETSTSVYARSKAMGERVMRDNFPDAIIIRPSVVFGPEDGFFNRFAAMARISPVLPVITSDLPSGTGIRFQPVYVVDLAEAIVRAANPAQRGKTFELGGPRAYTMREIYELVLKTVQRRRLVLAVPFWLAKAKASILQFLPVPPLTPDQVELLRTDNVVSGTAPGFKDLGIEPSAPEAILPTYLDRYRTMHRHVVMRTV